MSLSETSFIVTDTETVGPKADSGRIIEVGAVQVVNGAVVDEFSSLINPRRAISRHVRRLTGITTQMTQSQPTAEDVIPQYMEFLGEGVLVAHNLSFDLGFLNAELIRIDQAPIENDTLCTLRLARRLLRGMRAKGLSSVADFYGIKIEGRHRALGDARATAEILIRFLQKIEYEHNITTLEELLNFQYTNYRGLRTANPALEKIRSDILPEVPREPGVYFMLDRKGKIIYIGKAKNLWARVRTYFSAIEAHPARLRTLVDRVRNIKWEVLPSELDALIRESHLIKEHRPRFNRAQLQYRDRPFVRLMAQGDTPNVSLSMYLSNDGAEYFGPLSSRRQAARVLQIISRFFMLPVKKGKQAPRYSERFYTSIREKEGLGDLHEAAREVRAFLTGQDDAVLDAITEAMEEAAADLAFEEAAQLRDLKEYLVRLLGRQRFIAAPVMQHHGVVIGRDGLHRVDCLYCIRYGRLIESWPIEGDLDEDEVRSWVEKHFGDEGIPPERYSRAEIEDVRVLTHWLYAHRESVERFDWKPDVAPDVFATGLLAFIEASS